VTVIALICFSIGVGTMLIPTIFLYTSTTPKIVPLVTPFMFFAAAATAKFLAM
jgi:hypothetical protein